jgi:signal transduction histidine kinase
MKNLRESSDHAVENLEDRLCPAPSACAAEQPEAPSPGMKKLGEYRFVRSSERATVLPVTRPDINTREAALERSLRLEALGRLTGSVAHDFNNLLTIIVGNLEQLRDRSHDAFVQHGAKAALDAAVRGEKLVQSLLAFARRRPLCHRVFDLNAMIRDMDPLLRQSLGANIELIPALAPGVWPVETDVSQTEMAVLNLVVNARDAMPEGGVLRIETANVMLTGERDGLHGIFVALTVADTGCGMSPEVLARAFEPFFTTKAEGKGTGLGLSMVYGFARQSRGTAAIRSEPNEGTAVTIYLPRSVAPLGADLVPSPHR